MDSAADLRTLAEYAESTGRDELAQSMRLETPVFQPRAIEHDSCQQARLTAATSDPGAREA